MASRLRSPVVLLALAASVCSASAPVVGDAQAPLLNEKEFTVFAVRHGSSPAYPMSAIVADVRAVRFIRQHADEYGVDANRIGVYGGSAGGQLALLLGTTGDSGDRRLRRGAQGI